MDLRKLTNEVSVSPQIIAADVPHIAGAGFRSIMCNRPDGEEHGQPELCDIEAAAQQEGLAFTCVPIISGGVGQDDINAFDRALHDLPKPILAYCRSGTRCTMIWAITQVGRLDGDEIIDCADKAGYDVRAIVDQMQRR